MTYTVGFDAAARADLAELYDYILAEAGEAIARDYLEKLMDYCAGFETFPERGLRRDDIRPGLRIVGYRRRGDHRVSRERKFGDNRPNFPWRQERNLFGGV